MAGRDDPGNRRNAAEQPVRGERGLVDRVAIGQYLHADSRRQFPEWIQRRQEHLRLGNQCGRAHLGLADAWTAGSGVQAPHAVSVSPSSGSGPSQAFTFVYTDSSGASDLASAQAIVNAS